MKILIALLCSITTTFANTGVAPADIPYPDALDAAAVSQTKASDINKEALCIGNGDLNALVFEKDGVLCLRLAKNDIWDARINTAGDPPMLKIDLERQTWSGGGGDISSWQQPYPAPFSPGNIRIGGTSDSAARTPATLDLRRACATVGQTTVRALADRNVLLIESEEAISLKEIPATKSGETDGVKWALRKMPGDMDYAGMDYAIAVAGKGKQKAVAVVTSRDVKGGDVLEAAVKLARDTAVSDGGKLIAAHEAEWEKYWAASGVRLGDPDLQRWWYRMVYMLRCFSKPGVVPAGLWAFQPGSPAWHGDYHHNYNAWQPYWTPLIINHPDQTLPWVDYMHEMLPRLKWFAKETCDCEGAFVGISSFAFEPDPSVCKSKNKRQIALGPWGYTMGMIGISAHVLWMHHLYQPDRALLEAKIYPVIKEAALFFCSFAEQCPKTPQGKAKYGPSYSPEHGGFGVHDVPFDLAYARYTIKAAIAAAQELGRDAALVQRLRKSLELLPDYPTAPDKDGKPVVVDWNGCKFQEIGQHNIVVPAVPVFPAEQVTIFSSDAEKELFRNTMRQLTHNGNNSTIMFAVGKARLDMPEAVREFKDHYQPAVQPNGMFYWQAHGYYLAESVGIAAGIGEFLLQSVDNIIRVFPAWPKDKNASFTNLRAQGGFLVTAEQKGGKIVKLEITSTVGGRLRLLNPWTGKIVEYKTNPGTKREIKP